MIVPPVRQSVLSSTRLPRSSNDECGLPYPVRIRTAHHREVSRSFAPTLHLDREDHDPFRLLGIVDVDYKNRSSHGLRQSD